MTSTADVPYNVHILLIFLIFPPPRRYYFYDCLFFYVCLFVCFVYYTDRQTDRQMNAPKT